jgi:hypothetical protein
MKRRYVLPVVILISLVILTPPPWALAENSQTQDWRSLPMRKSTAWTPEMNNPEYMRKWEAQQREQQERETVSTTRTAKAAFLQRKFADIQRAEAAQDYAKIAEEYLDLAQSEQVGSFGPYGPAVNVLICYKQSAQAWLKQIQKSAQKGDRSGWYTAWERLRGPAAFLQQNEPKEPRWYFYLGKSYFVTRTANAIMIDGCAETKQWLGRCLKLPDIPAEMKTEATKMIAITNADIKRANAAERADMAAAAEYCRTHPSAPSFGNDLRPIMETKVIDGALKERVAGTSGPWQIK